MLKSSILLVSLAGGMFVTQKQDAFVSKGPVETFTRNIGGFDALEVRDMMQVIVEPGSGPITIKAPNDVYQFIRSRTEGNRLILDLSRAVELHNSDGIVVHVHANSLKSVAVYGACSVQAKSLHSHDMAVKVSGASSVNLGEVRGNLEAKIMGASTLKVEGSGPGATVFATGASVADLRNFSTNTVSVNLSGACSVQCNTKEVSGKTVGVSSVSAPHAKNTVDSESWPRHRH